MSQTLQNQILLAKSMNGIVSLSDGAGTTITGGQVITNDFSGNTITVNSFSAGTFDLNNSLTLEQYDNISTAVGLVSLWEKGKSYFTYLPQSLATPSNTSDLITLLFGNANYGRLTQTNSWTGVNTFPTQSDNNNTTRAATTAFVSRMLYYNQTTHNCAFNQEQYPALTTGVNNILVGFEAGSNITSGISNTALGVQALRACQSGVENFVLGTASMYTLTTGSYNVAIGVLCLSNTNGSYNIGIGSSAGGVSFGNFNTYIGYYAAISANLDGANTGIGSLVFPSLTTGQNCVAIGHNAGAGFGVGDNNTFIGTGSGSSISTISNSTAIGYAAQATTSNQIALGTASEITHTMGGLVIPAGGLTATATQTITFGSNAPTMSGANIASATIPDGALSSNVGLLTGTQTFTGAKTFSDLTAASPLKITETSSIVQITGGSTPYNVLKYNNLYDSIGIGKDTLNSLTTNAFWNIAIGSNALTTAQASRGCIGIGRDALKLFNGLAASYSYNVAIGSLSMQSATTSAQCVAIGGTTAQNLTTATGCTFLGNGTDFISTTQYNNSTAIGNNAKITAANQIMMGTSLETVNIPGSCSITGTCSITGATSIGGTLTLEGQQQSSAFTTLLTGTANFSGGLTHSAYSVVPPTTAFTITLPTITAANVGTQVVFRRITATNATTVVSFIGNGTQFVYNAAAVGGATAQPLMASGVYTVRLVSLVITTTPTYAWFMV